MKLLEGDGLAGVEAAVVDPLLDLVQVDGRHVDGEAVPALDLLHFHLHLLPFFGLTRRGLLLVLESSLSVHHLLRRLSTVEVPRDLAMLLLTLVTTTRRLALARRGTATSSYPLVVGARVVRQIREHRCRTLLLLCLPEKGSEE